jgi:hypothetical protein
VTTARQLRTRIDATAPGGRGRRLSRELELAIVDSLRSARAGGERSATIARELNVSSYTISRWLKAAGESAFQRAPPEAAQIVSLLGCAFNPSPTDRLPKDLEERCWAGSADPGCRSHYGNVRRQ